jgi:cytochrome c5
VLGAAPILALAAVLTAQELPAAPGVEVVRAKCTACHATDLIASQRLSPQGWTRELDKMVRWGAALGDSERAALQQYLETHFAPKRTGPGAPARAPRRAAEDAAAQEPPGRAVFERACRACHERDLVASQRLTRAGWQREVEKMMQWGAALADADKSALVDYLAARYPPR